MANGIFTELAQSMLGDPTHSVIDWDGDTIKAILVDHADVTPNLATHQDLADLSAAVVATSSALTCTVTAGVLDCDAFSFSAVSGDEAESLVFYKDSGTAATSPLGLYYDSATGLPITPNGADINVTPHASGLYGLV